MMIRFALAFLMIVLFSCESHDSTDGNAEQEVRQTSDAYMKALNDKDINALLNFWADEAVYRNPVTGQLAQGKEKIKKEYAILFEEIKKAKVAYTIHSITFPFEDKAVEEGVLHVLIPGHEPINHDYTMIFVRRNGDWKILNISEIDVEPPVSKK